MPRCAPASSGNNASLSPSAPAQRSNASGDGSFVPRSQSRSSASSSPQRRPTSCKSKPSARRRALSSSMIANLSDMTIAPSEPGEYSQALMAIACERVHTLGKKIRARRFFFGGSDAGGERVQVADHDRAPLQLDDARAFPILEVLVDTLPRAADHLAERTLRDLEAEVRRRGALSLLLHQTEQRLGDAGLEMQEGEILNLLVGPPDPVAQHDQQLVGDLGPPFEQRQQ